MIKKDSKSIKPIEELPTVSVIIPAYNASKYIDTAINSVFLQNVPVELIVVDDCSSDNLDIVMNKYLGLKNIVYIKNERNLGVAKSRNLGVRKSKGDYVAYLDADDWWMEGKLEKQISIMKKTGVVLCSTGRELVYSNGESTGRYIPVKKHISYKSLLYHNSINCSSVLVLSEVAKEFPMGNDEIHEDYITWLKILKKYKKAYGIDEPYLKYRLTGNGKSRNKIKSARMTFLVYRHMGFGYLKSIYYFICYAVHGMKKYI
ncbi:glycosyltransferase family 2 protein [Lacrimispora defluvii]|uniref:Glycosyltransferase family 2 protein n=1 Tax=Lacrimispora defluvii TaxID=2719233 RepID=A0ABX1VZY8_9FIRM|nr:glycosyltransferase family 2 protein [Lacrimispora defluvii]NNJ32990.1 glycosyltransferase family 2 protein [Lacrimispora defluvii]